MLNPNTFELLLPSELELGIDLTLELGWRNLFGQSPPLGGRPFPVYH